MEHLNPAGGKVAACTEDDVCEVLSCEVCLAEFPATSAMHADSIDYVHHFCGLDCLEAWRKRAQPLAAS
jgi:hypothetical protein